MNASLTRKCFDIFALAENAAADTPRYVQRIKKEKIYLLYSSLSDRSLTSRMGSERELFAKQLAEFIMLMREFRFSTVGNRGVPDTDWFKLISGITLPGTNWLYNPIADAIVANPVSALASGIFASSVVTLAETAGVTNISWSIPTKDMTGGEDYRPTVKCLRYGLNDRSEVQFRRPEILAAQESFLSLDLMSGLSGGTCARAEIILNGKRIYQDAAALSLSEETWRTVNIPLGSDVLPGVNHLSFTCINGTWVLVRAVTLVSGKSPGNSQKTDNGK